MNEIKLAELLEEKLKSERLDDDVPEKYIVNDWFVFMITSLFKYHEAILQDHNVMELSLDDIIFLIESYFEKRQRKRKLNQKKLRSFIHSTDKYRVLEDLILLLILGLKISECFVRLINNHREPGEILIIESDENRVRRAMDYGTVLPEQEYDRNIEKLFENIKNYAIPAAAIDAQVKNVDSVIRKSIRRI